MKKILACALLCALLASLAAPFAAFAEDGTAETETVGSGYINVYNWGEYISDGSDGSLNINEEFTRRTGITVNYTNYASNEDLYAKLKSGGASYDVIIPSDYMIGMMGTSGDIDATISCLRALGAGIERTARGVRVTPVGVAPPDPTLDCMDSGSTLRFLLPVAAALGADASFTGRGRLPKRPITALTSQLAAHGVSFTSDRLPLGLSGRLTGGEFSLPGDVSSQFITGLLLALPVCGGGTVALTSPLESASYVEITRSVMARFGVNVTARGKRFEVGAGQSYRSPRYTGAQGDWSGAAFFLAAGALSGEVTVAGLDLDSPQGDRAIVELLRRFGAEVEVSDDRVTARNGRKLCACEIDVSDVPDLLPVLAVVAASAEGETVFTGGRRLRFKESDRIASTAALIGALGGVAAERPDGLTVTGSTLTGGGVDSFCDHRIAMSAAVAATICTGEVKISDPLCAAKSYPTFYDEYNRLGGDARVV